MKILIVSDTHGRHGNLDEVLEKEGPIDLLIHLGDVEHEDNYIEAVAGCPTHIIAGNNDYFSFLPHEKEVRIGKYKAFLTHGHNYYVSMDTSRLRREALFREADIVMYGHTHKPYLDIQENLVVLNPGSLSYPRQEGRRPSYIIMEINSAGNAEFSLNYV